MHNIKDGAVIVYFVNKGSPWFNTLPAEENWLKGMEADRMGIDNIERPSTKWEFMSSFSVDVKAVLDRPPLLGTGPLPDWLRNLAHSRAMTRLDNFQDNFCLWHCIAVHCGARPDGSTKVARELVKNFYKSSLKPNDVPKTSLDEFDQVEKQINKRVAFLDWLEIRVYEPGREEDGEVVWNLRQNPSEKLKNILAIGVFDGHAFVIKNIAKLAKTYGCIHCRSHFTRANSLQRRYQTCTQGKTKIDCRCERDEAPQTDFERGFFPKHTASSESLRWLEKEATRWKIHIHHAMCAHGGEQRIERAPVDGYDPTTKTVFQYHGCYWHGCPRCYPDRETVIDRNNVAPEARYKATVGSTRVLRQAGYMIEVWACEVPQTNEPLPKAFTKS